jgi:hypothetical protein
LSDLWENNDPGHPEFCRPYEWVRYLPNLAIYEMLLLLNREDGYLILIPEAVLEAHPELKWVLTDESREGCPIPNCCTKPTTPTPALLSIMTTAEQFRLHPQCTLTI